MSANTTNAVIAGGNSNLVGSGATAAFIGGGSFNEVRAPGGVVPGGFANEAAGTNSFAAGSQAVASNTGTFVWADMSYTNDFVSTRSNQFIIRAAGGVAINTNSSEGNALAVRGNMLLRGDLEVVGQIVRGNNTTVFGTSVVGGGSRNFAGGSFAVIGGGQSNSTEGSFNADFGPTVAGGLRNTAAGQAAAVGGGELNRAATNHAVIAGGFGNTNSGRFSFVGGGSSNTILADFLTNGGFIRSFSNAVIAGGFGNTVGREFAVVVGGSFNTNQGLSSFIGAGHSNTIVPDARFGTLAGGRANTLGGDFSTIAGGSGNTNLGNHSFVGGGQSNSIPAEVFDFHKTISGGLGNTAIGAVSSVGGGAVQYGSRSWLHSFRRSLQRGHQLRRHGGRRRGQYGRCWPFDRRWRSP